MGGIEEWKGERRGRERGGEEREEEEEMGKEETGADDGLCASCRESKQ